MTDARAERAEAFRDYYALQLRFAEAVAERGGQPLGEAARRFTNLHRRLALGNVTEEPPGPGWLRFAERLEALPRGQARLDWTMAELAAAPDEPGHASQIQFGCFSYEPPKEGVVRIHFSNRDSADGAGPLAQAKTLARRSELTRMFAHLKRLHPEAKTIAGASWLYHTQAYRRLFPADYAASRTEAGEVRLNGTSSWGQFLTHSGAVKPALRDAFLANLDRLDPDAPWLIFPLRPLLTNAPAETFYAFYEV
ncbi:hypothetical protein [Phenylobacterium sp.]|uniref:hypothetical protein n=1 Tax=Phenylobacterium sp. TaxID=1871053 RepID=UPI00286A65BC|nr:hypothetical protein [Phenylobacterium sp.]